MPPRDEAGRPQDQGRKHRRRTAPSPETATLLADYQAAMRDELRALLDDLRGAVPDPGLGLTEQAGRVRPPLKERAPMWDLAMKLGRELGTSIDASPAAATDASNGSAPRRRPRRIDYGP